MTKKKLLRRPTVPKPGDSTPSTSLFPPVRPSKQFSSEKGNTSTNQVPPIQVSSRLLKPQYPLKQQDELHKKLEDVDKMLSVTKYNNQTKEEQLVRERNNQILNQRIENLNKGQTTTALQKTAASEILLVKKIVDPRNPGPKPYRSTGPEGFPLRPLKSLPELQKGTILKSWNDAVITPGFKSCDRLVEPVYSPKYCVSRKEPENVLLTLDKPYKLTRPKSLCNLPATVATGKSAGSEDNINKDAQPTDIEVDDYDPGELLDAISDWKPEKSFDAMFQARRRSLLIPVNDRNRPRTVQTYYHVDNHHADNEAVAGTNVADAGGKAVNAGGNDAVAGANAANTGGNDADAGGNDAVAAANAGGNDADTSGNDADTGGNDADTGGNDGNTGGNDGNTGGNDGNTGGNDGNTGGNDADTGGNDGNTGGNDADTGGNDGNTGGNDADTSGNDADTGGNDADTGGNDGDTGGNDANTGGNDADTGGNDADTGGKVADAGDNDAGDKVANAGDKTANAGGNDADIGGNAAEMATKKKTSNESAAATKIPKITITCGLDSNFNEIPRKPRVYEAKKQFSFDIGRRKSSLVGSREVRRGSLVSNIKDNQHQLMVRVDAMTGANLAIKGKKTLETGEQAVDETNLTMLGLGPLAEKKPRVPKHMIVLGIKKLFKSKVEESGIVTPDKLFESGVLEKILEEVDEIAEQHGLSGKERIKAVVGATQEYFDTKQSEEAKKQRSLQELLAAKANEQATQLTAAQMEILGSLLEGGEILTLKGHFISDLPDLSSLHRTLVCLNLSFNNFTSLPDELLLCDRLQFLKLRDNPLKSLPTEIYKLDKLKSLVVSFCCLTDLPSGLFLLRNLEFLDVSYNLLTSLSSDIEFLNSLTYLNLEGNELIGLPCTMLSLQGIVRVRIKNNFMSPAFWPETCSPEIPKLSDLCKHVIQRHYVTPALRQLLSKAVLKTLSSDGLCDCCGKPMYGPGMHVLRHRKEIWGLRQVPFVFRSCSSSCHRSFSLSRERSVTEFV